MDASYFEKGMVGQWFEEKNGNARIYIRGVSEWDEGSIRHIDQWVPAKIVEKGALWKNDIKDWKYEMNLDARALERIGLYTAVGQPSSNTIPLDGSVLARTVAGLLDEFITNPAPFMGTKISELLDKRSKTGKGSGVDSVVHTILEGIKRAGLYDVLNRHNFTAQDIVDTSTIKINAQLKRRTNGGVYLRYHLSTSEVQRWRPNVRYVYVGKAVDFRDRFDNHKYTESSYGDLTRNSALKSVALCDMDDQDNVDFAYLVEQLFVCLLESYREELHIVVDRTVDLDNDSAIRHAEAINAALYFRNASTKVFQITGYSGGTSRQSFGVSFGANYSSPFQEWSLMKEQRLFLRHDTLVKSRVNGSVMPISIFRSAKPKIAKYMKKQTGKELEHNVFMKMHQGKYFFGVSHRQSEHDGTMGPKQNQPYYIVFEVRRDGRAHPMAWSRLPEIGPFLNWEEGRALAARIEWEYPIGSGKFRFRYIQTRKIFTFLDLEQHDYRGSNINYYRSIAMTQWLFNAEPVHPQTWMARLRGCAYVLQTVYNYHTQTIEVKLPEPYTMRHGGRIMESELMRDMISAGLQNVNGDFRSLGADSKRLNCDTCALMRTERQITISDAGCKYIDVGRGLKVCSVCWKFGRPCCSWTPGNGFKDQMYYTEHQIARGKKALLNADEVAENKVWFTLLVAQPKPKQEQTGEEFTQQLIDVDDFSKDEDDFSDAEEEEEALVEDEGEGEDDKE
ncbi:uncharacterized protein J4E78_004547 [Alternaria triticimaculans]|uniref:uncharacterized protein n=1 Tax=Alternaria triticimaculans TaxID=297637 RepID=UPI0020C1ECEA|nr:uncharacterized protein J4E78_004547 [Alternaria triticimaculans]KAI4661757.1 hypothetical protein J4E78_004547 [Alternaria triticimaculans]